MFGHWDWIVAVQIVTKPVVFREASPCLLYEQYHVLPTTCLLGPGECRSRLAVCMQHYNTHAASYERVLACCQADVDAKLVQHGVLTVQPSRVYVSLSNSKHSLRRSASMR
eukprot:1154028-Pelagomonas_calceolata.AAC.2